MALIDFGTITNVSDFGVKGQSSRSQNKICLKAYGTDRDYDHPRLSN